MRRIDRSILLLVIMFVGPITMAMRPAIFDPDIWSHMRFGDWIAQHHAVPRTDTFSLGEVNQRWFSYSWLFEFSTAKLFHAFGLPALIAGAGLITAAIIFMLFLLLRSYQMRLTRAVVLVLWATLGLIPLLYLRSWLFTILFFLVELYLVLRPDSNPKRSIALTFGVFVLWSNLHIQFTYGLTLLGLFLVDAVVLSAIGRRDILFAPRWSILQRILLFAAAIAGTFVNPYGYHVYEVFWQYATQTKVFEYVQEFQPFSIHRPPDVFVAILAAAAIWTVGYYRERRTFLLLLLGGALYAALHVNRDIWLLVMVSAFVIAVCARPDEEEEPIAARSAAWAIGLTVVLTVFLWKTRHIDQQHLEATVAQGFPVEAANYIEQHHLTGPLFNSYDWGSYLIWRLPSLPVSIDGRTNLYGPEKLAKHFATMNGAAEWAKDPALRTARLIVIPKEMGLTSLLKLDACYQLAYSDKVSAVFTAREACLPGHRNEEKTAALLLNDNHR